jgi:hypothetical protein
METVRRLPRAGAGRSFGYAHKRHNFDGGPAAGERHMLAEAWSALRQSKWIPTMAIATILAITVLITAHKVLLKIPGANYGLQVGVRVHHCYGCSGLSLLYLRGRGGRAIT